MTIKEKFESGDYIIVEDKWLGESNYFIVMRLDFFNPNSNYYAIHKKHKDILDAYLLDNEVEIEFKSKDGSWEINDKKNFIDMYYEEFEFRLKEKSIFQTAHETMNKARSNVETIKAPNSDVEFLKPEFECELLSENNGNIIAIVSYHGNKKINVIYDLNGACYELDTRAGKILRWDRKDLTPYKKPIEWYEIESNFPCAIISDATDMFVIDNIDDFIDDFKNKDIYRLATNQEIDSLKVNLP